MAEPVSPYDDPAVSAGEIADYLDQLHLESTPSPPTAMATPSNATLSNCAQRID